MGNRRYLDSLPRSLKLKRAIWNFAYRCLFRPAGGPLFAPWRRWLLRRFGATIGSGCRIAPTCRVWAPWNLKMGDYVCLAPDVDCYSVDLVVLGDHATISQRAFLCTASHDTRYLGRPLIHKPITISKDAWICAEAFIGPGVSIGEGAVVAAKAAVFHDVPEWKIVRGNPANQVKDRKLIE